MIGRTVPPFQTDAKNLQLTRSAILSDIHIARLPLAFREVLVLREIEELSYEDIARVMEIPKGTVMSRLARARRQLQEMLEGTR